MTWNNTLTELHHDLTCAIQHLKKAKLAIEQGNKFRGYCLIGEAEGHIDTAIKDVVKEGEQ